MASNIQFKRGTAAALYAANPVLLRGEPGLEIDTNKIKYGNGVTPWRDLPYGNPALEVVDGGEFFAPSVPAVPGVFTPPTLDGLVLWLDANDPDYTHKVNNRLSMWEDLSETRAQFFQSNKANRPSMVNQIAEEDVVTFDGVNDAMLGNFALPAEFTLLVALRRRGSSTNGKLLTAYSANSATELVLCGTETGNSIGVSDGEDFYATQPVDDLVPAIYTLQFSEDGFSTRLNGLNTQADTMVSAAAKTVMAIGGDRVDFSADNFGGDVAEIVMYDRVLTAADLLDAENYMMERWGIVQVSHPLLEGMKAFWPLNEETGNRIDITDAEIPLTPTGTVGFEAGVVGNAANLTGAANYLTAPTSFTLTGSFSVSLWFKPDAVTGSAPQIIQNWAGGMQGQMVLGFGDEGNETGVVWAYVRTADDNYRVSAPDLEANRWYHVVLVFDQTGNKLQLYVDGVLADQVVTAGALMSTSIPLRVGMGEQTATPNTVAFLADQLGIWDRVLSAADVEMLYNDELGKEDFTADLYGDNVSLLLHMDKPANAVGGSGGADSDDPYFNDVALLLHMNGSNGSTTFTDSSANALTATVNGNAAISTGQSKFGGASGYFQSGSYIEIPDFPGIGANEDFTWEAWLHPTNVSGFKKVCTGSNGQRGSIFFWGNVFGYVGHDWGGAKDCGYPLATVTPNQWFYGAVTRQNGVMRIFVDGVLVYDCAASATCCGNTDALWVDGVQIGYEFDGYIDDLRITKGVARYTANFTPPTAAFPNPPADQYFNDVSLLLHMDGANNSTTFTDSSENGLIVTAIGGAQISTTQSKFGGASAYFDGSGASVTAAGSINFAYGTADFTVEMWLYASAYDPSYNIIFSQTESGQNYFLIAQESGNSVFRYGDLGGTVISGPQLLAQQWQHIAVVRSGGTVTLYVNGEGGTPTPCNFDFTDISYPIAVGSYDHSGDNSFTGYIDDLRITKGVARYTANFTPPTEAFPNPFVPGPTAALLLHFDGANGSTTFTDSGPNALTVTANGNAVISTAQSKFGGASGYFDGSGGFLQISSSDFSNFGSDDFTVETWLYCSSFAPVNLDRQTIAAQWSGGGAYIWMFEFDAENLILTQGNNGFHAGQDFVVPWTPTPNTWQHVAVSRENGVVRMFLNGQLLASGNYAFNMTGTADLIIGKNPDNNTRWLNGYLDDFRIVKGTALYTADFTPPTAAFPNPPADQYFNDVSLLLHMDGANNSTTFTDSSENGLIVTAIGGAQISTTQSKFGGASAYFDGSGASVTAAGSINFAYGTADFTVEMWLYASAYDPSYNIIFSQTESGQNYFLIAQESGNSVFRYGDLGGTVISGPQLLAQQWQHIAVVRSGGTVTLYVNGEGGTPTPCNFDFTDISYPIAVGSYDHSGDNSFTGYIDDLRITKGVARYTANFTPPTEAFPNPFVPGPTAALLLHFDGANGSTTFTDSGPNALTVTANGNAVISTAQSKFGGASGYFDGSGGFLQISSSDFSNFGSDDFTVETWLYCSSFAPVNLDRQTIAAQWSGGGAYIWMFEFDAENLILTQGNNGFHAGQDFVVPWTPTPNTWQHVAVSRENGVVRMFLNGQLLASGNYAFNMTGTADLIIGKNPDNNTRWLNGYLDDFRIVKGTALYTADFTPPTAAFPDQAGGGGTGPITTFIDSSKHNHELTAVGNAYLNLIDIKYGSGSGEFAGGHCTIPMSPEFAFGTGDFTVEFWGNLTYAANSAVFSIAPESEEAGTYLIGFRNDANMFGFCYDMPNFTFVSADISAYYGEWAHYAFVRLDGVLKMYVNGTQVGTANTTIDFDGGTQTTAVIGRRWVDVDDHYLDGLIDDLRITKGVARYIANFNPPTKAFPDPVLVAPPAPPGDQYAENVTLLLHMDGANGSTTFTDNSYLQNTVTAEGGAVISTAQSKWGGASAYFDGVAGTRASVADSNPTAFEFDGDFTIEAWVYPTASNLTREIVGRNSDVQDAWVLRIADGALQFYSGQGSQLFATAGTIELNQWTHVAVSRSGTSLRLFVAGIQAGSTFTLSGPVFGGTGAFFIGGGTYPGFEWPFAGHIDDLRITKGVARYTANFTPPTVPFPSPFVPGPTADLLLHFDGSNGSTTFTDSSPNGLTVTANGDAEISTAQSKFGGASLRLVAAGDYASFTGLPNIGTQDFCIEYWIYPSATNSAMQVELRNNTTLAIWSDGLNLWTHTAGTSFGVKGQMASGWNHIALARQSTTIRLFINGVEAWSATEDSDFATGGSGENLIGKPYDLNWSEPDFYMDEFRLVIGQAVYTSNFTPPTAPFRATADVTPTDITGCDLWLDSTGDIAESNGAILTWADKSGNGRTATPADYAPAPIVAAGDGPNGQDVVRFSGDPNVLDVSYQFNLKNSSGFILLKQPNPFTAPSGYQRVFSFQPETGSDFDQTDGLTLALNNFSSDGVEIRCVGPVCTYATPFPFGWTLIAYSVDASGNVTLRVDGEQVATGSNATMAATAGGNLYIGHGGGFLTEEALTGDIAEISLFDHALGEAALIGLERGIMQRWFPAPTPPALGSTVLLLHMDGSNGSTTFTDSSPNGLTVTAAGGAAISTTQSKFGGASAYFDGNSYLSLSSDAFSFGANDFTIEFWTYIQDDAGYTYAGQWGGSTNAWFFGVTEFYINSPPFICSYATPSLDSWHHIAACRKNGTIRIFTDGEQVASANVGSVAINSSDTFIGIGGDQLGNTKFMGYIDEFRITKGVARYTANFTPPTQPFPSWGNVLSSSYGANIVAAYDFTALNTATNVVPAIIGPEMLAFGLTRDAYGAVFASNRLSGTYAESTISVNYPHTIVMVARLDIATIFECNLMAAWSSPSFAALPVVSLFSRTDNSGILPYNGIDGQQTNFMPNSAEFAFIAASFLNDGTVRVAVRSASGDVDIVLSAPNGQANFNGYPSVGPWFGYLTRGYSPVGTYRLTMYINQGFATVSAMNALFADIAAGPASDITF